MQGGMAESTKSIELVSLFYTTTEMSKVSTDRQGTDESTKSVELFSLDRSSGYHCSPMESKVSIKPLFFKDYFDQD